MSNYKPVVLAILDGWGVAPDSDGNAITRANLPNLKKFLSNYPAMTLHASGNEVGLSFGEMGNSEVGHLNIGAGRVYYQSLPRINREVADGSFVINAAFLAAVKHVKDNKSKLHLVGLVSNGNVHASDEHLYALLKLCAENDLGNKVFVHGILDGRDTIFNSGKVFIQRLQDKMKELKTGRLATLCGRYYAMDRNNHWDRTAKTYQAMVLGQAARFAENPLEIIEESYAQKNYDEEFIPTVMTAKGEPVATIGASDAVIFFNFRPDRARQLTEALVLPAFSKFERQYLDHLYFVTMTEYEKDLPVVVAYPPVIIFNSLAEVISKAGKQQFHIAETEKYAHVTFFLNGTIEDEFPGETRSIVPSPKVTTYDQAPAMSAGVITKEIAKVIDAGKYDFIVVNFANADMVGHSGNLDATISACEKIDECLGTIAEHVLSHNGVLVITADHGNAEEVINLQTGAIDKEHSTNPVPLIIVGRDFMGQAGPAGDAPEGDLSLFQPVGILADMAPTVLKLMGLEQPAEMTGQALI
ncbi:MAG: 2,3-bisphosphoglycerate-independent phosphoglycerate mutase [bacterium]|nr:2,3-bisphosphoglycerate-independent phosphoglycerate mutase [bacterium]